jgi:hypothetical protein
VNCTGVAQRFLDGAGGQVRVGAQRRELVRVPQQRQDRVRDQRHRGLVPGHQQQHAGGDQLLLGKALPVVLGADELGQQVVGRAGPAGGDQLAEVVAEFQAGLLGGGVR